MRLPARTLFRSTRVVTASGVRIGWLRDLEVDLETGQICQIGVARRWWMFRSIHWIPKTCIIRWEKTVIIVQDAWLETVKEKRFSPNASIPAVSCSYDRSA
jgi:sporulation protein YlmC with PRC-barrel domain